MTSIIDIEKLTVPQREHRDGCPAGRAEAFPSVRADGSEAVVVRCIDCGGQAVFENYENGATDAGER